MKQAIAWRIDQTGKPTRLKPGSIDLEKHLEDWVDVEIDIVADDVLIIGRQLVTSWGTKLDLLGIDGEGNLVIIELKRDQTLRETIAQGLEYAAWASKQSYDEVLRMASDRFEDEDSFKAAFLDRFKTELPTTLNQLQRVLVVAPSIDDTTDTVVRYLADTYRLPINAVSFDVFGEAGNQVLVRHFVRDQSLIPSPPTAKTRPMRTIEELLALSADNEVRDVVDSLRTLSDLLPHGTAYFLCFNLRARTADKRLLTGISVYPTAESTKRAVELLVGSANLTSIFGLDPVATAAFVDDFATVAQRVPYNYPGWAKFILRQESEASDFCMRVRRLVGRADSSAGTDPRTD